MNIQCCSLKYGSSIGCYFIREDKCKVRKAPSFVININGIK